MRDHFFHQTRIHFQLTICRIPDPHKSRILYTFKRQMLVFVKSFFFHQKNQKSLYLRKLEFIFNRHIHILHNQHQLLTLQHTSSTETFFLQFLFHHIPQVYTICMPT